VPRRPYVVATEGWDWIPAIRDRDTGIWQPVVVTVSGGVTIGDAQVVTKLPLPAINRADVEITVPLENASALPVQGTIKASFDQTAVTKAITVPPGKSTVTLTSAEFAQLIVQNPASGGLMATASRSFTTSSSRSAKGTQSPTASTSASESVRSPTS